MDKESKLTTDALRIAMEMINKPDPLEEAGIPKDWVCVIHPRLEYVLKDHFKLKGKAHPTMIGLLYNPVQRITGRKTFIIFAAPDDKIEYMPEVTMYIKYANYFISLAELQKMRDGDDNDIKPEN